MSRSARRQWFGWAVGQAGAAVLVLLGTSLALFLVLEAAPGRAPDGLGTVTAAATGPGAPGDRAGWAVRYGRWVAGAVRGELGRSTAVQRGRPVAELLGAAARRSLSLSAAAFGLAVLAAAVVAAGRRVLPGTAGVVAWGVHLASALPVFLLVYGAVVWLNPAVARGVSSGWWDAPRWFPFPARPEGAAWWLGAGLLAVGDGFLSDLCDRFSAETDAAHAAGYRVGARLLRLPRVAVAVRATVPGVADHLAGRVTFLLGSLVVLESALGWPGLGYLAWRAAAERDLPVLLAVAVLLAVVVRIAAVAAGLVRAALDPRYRGPG